MLPARDRTGQHVRQEATGPWSVTLSVWLLAIRPRGPKHVPEASGTLQFHSAAMLVCWAVATTTCSPRGRAPAPAPVRAVAPGGRDWKAGARQ